MKDQRHSMIIEIVGSTSVGTQEELRKKLSERGIEVTQATLSRDMSELGLIKRGERYILPEKGETDIPPLLKESIKSVDHAMNTVVFKCLSGMAMAVCATFDSLNYSSVVGTLAGDDTIFVLMRSEKDAAMFARKMETIIFSGKVI